MQDCTKHFVQIINILMIYKIIRHDQESDDITQQSFDSYDEVYDVLEEIYSDVCCSVFSKLILH